MDTLNPSFPLLTDADKIARWNAEFLAAEPFHHLVIDDFLDPLTAAHVELELRTLPETTWVDQTSMFRHINNQADGPTQSKKVALNDRAKLPPKTSQVIDMLQSPAMLTFLSRVTGIEEPLLNDEGMLGGGAHRTTTDGRLAIHCDFNIHPVTQKHRRLNVLLYLNSDWKPEHRGELELWDPITRTCARKIEPIANRLVLFRITDDALHGHPTYWTGDIHFPRLSLALYYYTDDRPEGEKAPFHWAMWYKRTADDY